MNENDKLSTYSKSVLDQSSENLGAQIEDDLYTARTNALRAIPSGKKRTLLWWSPMVATAFSLVVYFGVLPDTGDNATPLLNSPISAALNTDTQLVEDLDFYVWLANSSVQSGT